MAQVCDEPIARYHVLAVWRGDIPEVRGVHTNRSYFLLICADARKWQIQTFRASTKAQTVGTRAVKDPQTCPSIVQAPFAAASIAGFG